jgi:creatinine amidohydrolase
MATGTDVRSGYWQDLTTRELAGLDPATTIALLPVAAIEQHGPHLPLSTDALINEAIVAAALPRLPDRFNVLVLPAMTIGTSVEHTAYAGTLSLEPETLLAAWKQVGGCVARAGIRKLVILNTHGGQRGLVDLAALALRAEHAMLVVRASYFGFGMPPGLFPADELADDIHGGLVETSLLLHLRPDLVRRDAIRDFAGLPRELAASNTWLGAEKPLGIGWMSQDLHPEGVSGNAANADAERGAAYFEHIVASLTGLLDEVAATSLAVLKDGPRNR